MMNQCNFIGRLGKDPVLKQDYNGIKAFCTIAVSEKWTNSDGSKGERTNWIPLAFRGGLAGVVGEYLKKGSLIFVSGSLDVTNQSDGKGNYNKSIMVRVGTLTMLSSERSEGAQANTNYPRNISKQGYQDVVRQNARQSAGVAQNALEQAREQVNSAKIASGITPNVSDDDMPF